MSSKQDVVRAAGCQGRPRRSTADRRSVQKRAQLSAERAVHLSAGRNLAVGDPSAAAIVGTYVFGALELLDILVEAFKLRGPAAFSLGTALRVPIVRDSLQGEILKTCGYISDAGDAFRHLTPAVVQRTVAEVRAAIDSKNNNFEPAASRHEHGQDSSEQETWQPWWRP